MRRLKTATLALSILSAISNAHAGRIWHVAIDPLKEVAQDRQFRSINEAARMVEPGDVVLIHDGTYAEMVVIEKSGTRAQPIRFEAAPAANVVITGAERMVGWEKEGNHVFSIDWPHRFLANEQQTHPDDEFHRLIGRCEQVFANGYALQQVLAREQLGRGSYYVDLAAKRLIVSPATSEELKDGGFGEANLEASTRSTLWDCKGDYVQVRNVRFRYAANPAQQGAAIFHGRGDMVENCIFERMNAAGAAFVGVEQIVRGCTFQDNGQLGFAAYRAHDLRMSDCVVRNNNSKGFNRQWEAGGNKLVLCRGVILEKCQFLSNRGSGVWFDIGNENSTVRNCLIADNEGAGIFYEISTGLHAHDNLIVGNGLTPDPASWGAQGGIAIASSPHCVIERNLLVGNKEGLDLREQLRTTRKIDNPPEAAPEPIWNHDEVIIHNVIAYNRGAQSWGWFDVPDERHWPAPMQTKKNELSLETLRIRFANNFYATQDGQGLFNWGVSWSRHERYVDLARVRRELNFEPGSRVGAIGFLNPAARDFRVPKENAAMRMNCYPRGLIPGAITGNTGR